MSATYQAMTVKNSREVERLINGTPTSDGAGVKLSRVLTQNLQRRLDPFLMLDEFRSDNPNDYIAGFPDHPHRGFETITYMLAGRMRHLDNAGNEGLLTAGSVQWMTAGRGLIHSEIPEQENGLMHGFQLWLKLPSKDKLCKPWYRDISADEIPSFHTEAGVKVHVIAGNSHGVKGAMHRDTTEPFYVDVELPTATHFEQPIPAEHNAFIYVYSGRIQVGSQAHTVSTGQMGILTTHSHKDGIVLNTREPAKALIIAGKPLHEPIVQLGPFVMNTREEIEQAVADFRTGRF